MNKYALLKRFHYEGRLQFYMYAFMYANPEIIPVEEYFAATWTFFANYKKMSTPGPVPKNWLGFSYINSEDYELDMNFDETEFKRKSDHTSNNKVKSFRETIVVIEE